jgi:hypothetical protein
MAERYGEIKKQETAAICQSLNCTLFMSGKIYPICRFKFTVDENGRKKEAKYMAAAIYRTQVPVGCPKEYDQLHPVAPNYRTSTYKKQ